MNNTHSYDHNSLSSEVTLGSAQNLCKFHWTNCHRNNKFQSITEKALLPTPTQPAYTLTINTIQPYRDLIQRPALEHTSCEPELDVVHKLDKGAFFCLVQTIDENMYQDSPQVKTQRNSTCNWPPGTHC